MPPWSPRVAEQYCLPEQACLLLGCLIFMFLRWRLGGAVGVFWCSLRQGAPGFISTLGASWAAGHRTWLFCKGWISTGSGAMKDSVLSAWFFKEEIRAKFPWGRVRLHVSLLKTLQTTKTGWSSRHTPETLTHRIKKQVKNQSLSVADWLPKLAFAGGTRIHKDQGGRQEGELCGGPTEPISSLIKHLPSTIGSQKMRSHCYKVWVMTGQRRDAGDLRTTLASKFILFFLKGHVCTFQSWKGKKGHEGTGKLPLANAVQPLPSSTATISSCICFARFLF